MRQLVKIYQKIKCVPDYIKNEMSEVETCSKCGNEAPKGTDSEGRCRKCSPEWPKEEYTGPKTRADAIENNK